MTLYRKYRPQFFKELIGQKHIRTTLENEIKQNKIAHAYLFTGSRGIGKTTMARLLAKALNCQERKRDEAEPCNRCFVCQEINRGHFLDLIEIDAASNRGINEIRELKERVKFVPSLTRYKIFIIDEVHMLTPEAFNALLKTLEEPPKHVVFILATTEPYKLPETIISRCQRFDFKKIDPEEISKRLEKIAKAEGIKIEKEVLRDISFYGQGSSRDAENLLGQILSLGEKKIGPEQLEIVLPRRDLALVIELIEYLNKKETKNCLSLINQLIEEGVDLEQFTKDLIEFLRRILLFKINREIKDLDKKTEGKIQSLSQEMRVEELIDMIELFREKKDQLRWAEIPQLPLELAVVSLISCKVDKIGPADSLLEKKKNSQNVCNNSVHQTSFAQLALSKEEKNLTEKPISLKEIQDKWGKVLEEVKKYNHSLSAFLKIGKVVSCQDNVLFLNFPFKFHQEKIKDIKNKRLLEEILSRVLEIKKIRIESKVEKEENKSQETFLNKIIGVFGKSEEK